MNKGNTVSRGNQFENKVYGIISNLISRKEFGMLPECCKIYRKKKYPSVSLNDEIEFDLSIEVTLPGAKQYSYLYLIEIKDYRSKIPGSDLSEFVHDVKAVAGLQVKAIFVSTTDLQPRAMNIAKSEGIMWIKVTGGEHQFRLYSSKKRRGQAKDTDLVQLQEELKALQEISMLIEAGNQPEIDWDSLIEKLIRNAAEGNIPEPENGESGIIGLERLSGKLIENIAKQVLNDFDPNILTHALSLNADQFILFLKEKHEVTVKYEFLAQEYGYENSGAYIPQTKTIIIDPSIVGTDRFKYVLLHEAGHHFLHNKISVNQKAYDRMEDSRYNSETGKHDLLNERNWLEWQAKKFAAYAIMPDVSVMARLLLYQYANGIRNKGRIYVDNAPQTLQDFYNTISTLRNFFEVTEIIIEYRLGDIGILKFSKDFRRPIPVDESWNSNTSSIGDVLISALRKMEMKSWANKKARGDEPGDPF